MARLASEGRFDYLLIESTGISEPLPVAQTFTFSDAEGRGLPDLTRLDTMVTLLDTADFLERFGSTDLLSELNLAAGEGDERSVADLLIDQIEFANVIVLNKADRVPPSQLERLEAIVTRLNPGADILTAVRGRVPLDRILNTGLFDMEKAQASAGWIAELNRIHTPETDAYGIGSFTFRAHRPFHPERFWEFINTDWPGMLRSKGFFWLASRHDVVAQWSQAGGTAEYRPVGYWWAATPTTSWPDDPESQNSIREAWHEPFGDRRQELVFIGQQLPREEMFDALRQCLLDDREMHLGPTLWRSRLRDPFPEWSTSAPGEQASAS